MTINPEPSTKKFKRESASLTLAPVDIDRPYQHV
jgi:hypothetical protein